MRPKRIQSKKFSLFIVKFKKLEFSVHGVGIGGQGGCGSWIFKCYINIVEA